MPLWKLLLLHAYYRATLPQRWWIKRRLAARRRTPIVVLFYHRIADDAATEWTMATRTFIEQVSWLQRSFELISMQEVQRRLRSGANTRPALHITFDDGYADNCHAAIPWLVKERIPCTYFVTAQNILEGGPFEHDVKAGACLQPNSLEEIRAMAAAGIEIGAHTYGHSDLGKVTDPARTAPRTRPRPARPARGPGAGNPLFRLPLRPARQPELLGLRDGGPQRLRVRLLGLRRIQLSRR